MAPPPRYSRSRLMNTSKNTPRRDRDARLFVLAVEGVAAEPEYFSWLQHARLIDMRRVKLHVIPPAQGDSAPHHVVERLRRFRDDTSTHDGDAFWLIADVDRWGDAHRASVAREVKQARFEQAWSYPCFEAWMLLHELSALPPLSTASDAKKRWGAVANTYAQRGDTNRPFCTLDWIQAEHLRDAVARAQRLDALPDALWPTTPGSQLYRLFLALRDAGAWTAHEPTP